MTSYSVTCPVCHYKYIGNDKVDFIPPHDCKGNCEKQGIEYEGEEEEGCELGLQIVRLNAHDTQEHIKKETQLYFIEVLSVQGFSDSEILITTYWRYTK